MLPGGARNRGRQHAKGRGGGGGMKWNNEHGHAMLHESTPGALAVCTG